MCLALLKRIGSFLNYGKHRSISVYIRNDHFVGCVGTTFFGLSILPTNRYKVITPDCQIRGFSSVQSQSCPPLFYPMNCSTPGLSVHHQLPEFTQTHVHRVRDATQPSHPLSSPSPPAPNPSQHQSLFQ